MYELFGHGDIQTPVLVFQVRRVAELLGRSVDFDTALDHLHNKAERSVRCTKTKNVVLHHAIRSGVIASHSEFQVRHSRGSFDLEENIAPLAPCVKCMFSVEH